MDTIGSHPILEKSVSNQKQPNCEKSMFLHRITLLFAKWRLYFCARFGVVNIPLSNVVFFQTLTFSSTANRFSFLLLVTIVKAHLGAIDRDFGYRGHVPSMGCRDVQGMGWGFKLAIQFQLTMDHGKNVIYLFINLDKFKLLKWWND